MHICVYDDKSAKFMAKNDCIGHAWQKRIKMNDTNISPHGGDVEGYIKKYGKEPLDFSASISPLGLPEGVKRAVENALNTPQYPDPFCRRLRAAIARVELSLPSEMSQKALLSRKMPDAMKAIICANGGVERTS